MVSRYNFRRRAVETLGAYALSRIANGSRGRLPPRPGRVTTRKRPRTGQKTPQRFGFPMSYTKTKKKKKVNVNRLQSHADMSLIKFRMKGPRSVTKVDRKARISYTDTYASHHEGNSGVQLVFMGRYVHHYNQLLPNATNVTKNDRSTWSTPIFLLNPNRLTSGSAALPAQTVPTSEAIFASYQKTMLTITNLENCAAHCEVYWLLAKTDGNNEPLDTWSLANQGLGLGQPVLTQPTSNTTAGTAGQSQAIFYGQDATDNPYFKKFWHVVEKREFLLQSGNTLRYEFTRPINKMIRRPDLTVAATGGSPPSMFKHLTFVPMFVIKGTPVMMRLATGETEAQEQINYSTTKVGIMQTDTLIYYELPNKTLPLNRAFSNQMVQNAASLIQEFIDDEDDLNQMQRA